MELQICGHSWIAGGQGLCLNPDITSKKTFTMDEKMMNCCPNCSQLYYILTLSPELKGNIPRYLTCGHSMCENCIKHKVKSEEPMECKICHKNMEVEQNDLIQVNQIKINQVFPINKYMLGEIIGQVIENNEYNHPETDNTKDVQQQSKPKTGKTKEITKPSTFGKEILKQHVKAGSMTSPSSFDSNHSSQPEVKPSYVSYDNPAEQQVVPETESTHKELVEDVSYDNPAEQQVVPETESTHKELVEDVSYDNPAEQQVVPETESTHKELVEGSQEEIYITHIVNPHHFFVQRACHQELVKKQLREFRNIGLLPQPFTKHVNKGKLYLAFNKAVKRWQRCCVLSIDQSDMNKPLYAVFFIDFGSTEIVEIDKIRLLPPTRELSPFPLAINCALANCVPISGAWDSDDALLIQKIVDNKQAIIHVRKVVCMSNYSAKLNCDLFTYEDGASVAHALVFHERANLQDARHIYAQIAGACEKPKLLVSNNDYKYRATYEVYLTHVASPSKFYVRKQCVQSVYEKLCEEMEQEYSIDVNSGAIYLPEIGGLYAVNVELRAGETGWCRGIVVQLPGRQRVRLQLCDTGNVVSVHYSALRKIHHKFTTLMALATECHLSGVSPLNKKWSKASVTFLSTFEGHVLELNVKNESKKNSIGVTLYEKSDLDNVICINKEMIKHKFAVSFGCSGWKILSNLRNEKAPKISRSEDLDAKDKGPLRLEAKVITDADTGPQTPECEASTSAVEKYTNKVLVSDRLPLEPAVHTYTNDDGVMYMLFCMLSYLYVISKQDAQDLIHKALEDPCNVLLDSKFSRGRTLSVNKELLSRLTHYIYYGYEEQRAFADMRKNIAFCEIRFNTNQAQKCILKHIKPAEGHWDRQTLDYIHKSIVKKQCLLKIKGPAVDGVIMIDLKFDKLLINAHLVEFEITTYIDGTKAAVSKFA